MFPTLFHFGHLSLPTFGALAAAGLMLALLLSERTALLTGVDPAKLWDAGIFAVIAAFVLSRILLVVLYWKTFAAFPLLLLTVPSLTPIGLLLTAIATGIWLWIKRVPLLAALNAWAPCATLVWACLGLGHWAEGSDPGMPLGPSTHPIGLYVGVSHLLLAKKRGMFRDAGLTVELTQFNAPSDNLQALVAGALDVSHNPWTTTMAAFGDGNNDLRIIGGSGASGIELVARKGSVKTVAEFAAAAGKGLRVGTLKLDTLELVGYGTMVQHGRSYKDYEMTFFRAWSGWATR